MADIPLTKDMLRSSIKTILRTSDLQELSSKKVRKLLEDQYLCDLTLRKQEVDDLLMEEINKKDSDEEGSDAEVDVPKNNNQIIAAAKPPPDATSDSDDAITDRAEPLKKKRRKSNGKPKVPASTSAVGVGANSSDSDVDDDATIAARLQAEEKGVRFRRQPEKKTRKPAINKDGTVTKRKGTSVYSKICQLSEELSDVLGTDKMPRNEVVSKMWAIFKERNLFDPTARQYIMCDDQLERVFKKKRIKAFGMMKYLKSHIKDADLIAS